MHNHHTTPIRIGVIGAGRMGERHCRVFSNMRQASLVAVFDPDQPRAAQVAAQSGAVACPRLEDLLAQVDAVSIASPTGCHYSQAWHALSLGKHVLVEKPFTATLAEAQSLVNFSLQPGQVLQVGHIERFNPVYTELRNVLSGMTLLAVDVRRLSPFQGSNTDVDVISDLLIHDLDLALDLLGRLPNDVTAFGLSAATPEIDHIQAHLTFAGGPLVSLSASRLTERKIRSIEVTALEAFVEADLLNKSILVHRQTYGEYLSLHRADLKYRQESIVERIHVPFFEPLFLELQSFVSAIVDQTPARVTAQDGLHAQALAEQVRSKAQASVIGIPGDSRPFAPVQGYRLPLDNRQIVD